MHCFIWLITILKFFIFINITEIFVSSRTMHRSEGSFLAMQGGGVDASVTQHSTTYPTKKHGSMPLGDFGQVYGNSSTHKITRIQKRSLRRAYHRLQTQGFTWYRGQFWQQQIVLPPMPTFQPQKPSTPNFQPVEHVPKNRLVVYHWNGGALSSAKYHELLIWLHHQRIDVAIISETHWTYTAEWQTPHWNAIHSGKDPSNKDKASGILILIANRLCRSDCIVWKEVEAGRLVHCRLHLSPRLIDLIGIYQYPWNTSVKQKTCRKQIWNAFRQLLQELPSRNTLCILGDFNCSLPSIPRLVGQDHFATPDGPKRGPQHGDMSIFSQILNDFQLVALNTWSIGLTATSFTPSGASRIDFIMVRLRDCDQAAKQVGQFSDAPFLTAGAFHVPIMTSVNYKYFRQPRTPSHRFPKQVKARCLDEFRQDSPHWQCCANGVDYTLRTANDLNDLHDIYRILHQGAMHYFQKDPQTGSASQPGFAELKWQHYAKFRSPGFPTLFNLFRRWQHFTLFHKMDKMHARWVKQVRQSKIQQLTVEAQRAFQHHDSFKLYHAISRACPKQRLKRTHLKNDRGEFMTPTEETAAYVKYIADNWQGPPIDIPDLPTPGVPFTLPELEQVIATIPSTKAVAPGFAPGPMWKSQSLFIAKWLMEQLHTWWNQNPPFIPQEWKDAWACWLPKPHKPSTRLENLRMLGLQEPLGKAVLKLIAKKALYQTLPRLGTLPQYAYLPFRSTRDAILRGAAHCRAVRQLLADQKRSIHASTAAQPRLHCAGGIMLFIDLHRAFDQVSRPIITAALNRINLDPKLQNLILNWLKGTNYNLEINQMFRSVETTRGVRQGCSCAPYLWTTVIALLLDNLTDQVSYEWIRNNITIFADDIFVHCIFRSTDELEQATYIIDRLLLAIEQLGLQLSPAKSSVLIRGKGPGYEKWKKKNIRADHSKVFHILLCEGKVQIPLKKISLYLGIQLSYDHFERQSVELRVQAGWNNFNRLKPWFCRKYRVSLHLRLELMRTCIIPTLCYGILFTGLHERDIQLICQTIHQMYRRILGNLPHHTRESHSTVVEKHHLDPPLLILDKLATQAHKSLFESIQHVSIDDVIHLTPWTTLNTTRTLITSRLCSLGSVPDSDTEPEEHACIYCAFLAPSLQELQRHQTLVHDLPRSFKRQVDYLQDTTDGKPQCKHCGKMFLKWSSFNLHCRTNVCGAIPIKADDTIFIPPDTLPLEEPATMEPGPQHQEYSDRAMVYAVEADYASVRGDRRLCDYLQFHCILCSKHMSNTKAITAHMRANHPAQLQEAIALGIQRMRQYTGNQSPCSFCHIEFNKTHLCPVFLQMGILELQAVTPDDPLHFTCFLCQFVAADRAQLKKHLTRLHQFPCHDWTPARDSLEDGVTCAHCGSVHHCQQALRKHIIYGHCPQFDPARPWTRNGDADIVEHVNVGRIDLILANAEMKRRLTHECQFCTQKFVQVSNLVGHLLQQHSELAADGELYRQALQQRFAPRGCSCIPRIKQYRSTHTCVLFHQMSMIHFNGNALLNIPLVYDDAARDRMDTHVPMKSYLLVHDALKSRDFELLQQDLTFRDTLSRLCLCCGKSVTLTGPAKEHTLRHHLTTMHLEPQQAIQCVIQMVIHRKGHDHLTTCDWCGVTIVPNHATNEYDDHLAECPVLLHFVTWLLIPLTSPSHSHGSRAGGHGHSDQGCAGSAGGLRGSKRPLSEEAKKDSSIGATIQGGLCKTAARNFPR